MSERKSFASFNKFAALRQRSVQGRKKYLDYGTETGKPLPKTNPFIFVSTPGKKYLDYRQERVIDLNVFTFRNQVSYYPNFLPPPSVEPYVDFGYVLSGYVSP